MTSGFSLVLTYLLVAVRRILTVAWIRFNKFLTTPPAASKSLAKVAVIGDGYAEGLGDWVVMGAQAGPARFIDQLIRESSNVRTPWEIVNRGRAGTVSKDWCPPLPDDGKTEQQEQQKAGKGLWEKQARSKACWDAEVFVLVLGTMDVAWEAVGMPMTAMAKTAMDDYAEDELCDTVKNIRRTCDALLAAGKSVVVCSVMTEGAMLTGKLGLAKRVNRQLQLYVKGKVSDGAYKEKLELVKLHEPRIVRTQNRAFDGLHLNNKGYKMFATVLFEKLEHMLTASEWSRWKGKLEGSDEANKSKDA
ncbi:unnamed protein product [Chrysoparadoxa australica]